MLAMNVVVSPERVLEAVVGPSPVPSSTTGSDTWMIVILLVVAASSVAVPLTTACGLLVCGLGMTKGVISAKDLNESDELEDSFRCCFFFVLFSLLFSTLAVNVRASEEDGEDELSDVSESVSWGLVVCAVVASSVVDT